MCLYYLELTIVKVVPINNSVSAILIIKELHFFMDRRLGQEFYLYQLLAWRSF